MIVTRAIAFYNLVILATAVELCRDNEPCCKCTPNYGVCTAGDEDWQRGCAWRDFTCATECPGDYPWKKLYNQSRQMERELFGKCGEGQVVDPTKDWPAAEPGGR